MLHIAKHILNNKQCLMAHCETKYNLNPSLLLAAYWVAEII
nr:MAG TPA: hypothetical protein [Caudoviricetes sp.]